MKTLITHYDLDGVASAIILSQGIKFDKVLKGGYHRLDKFIDWVTPGSDVVISDCCFTVDQFAKLKQKAGKIIYIDHHPASQEIKDTFTNDLVIYDNTRAASGLCLDFIQKKKKLSKELNMLATAANTYDLFLREEMPNWFAFGYDLNILFWEYHFDEFVARFINGFDKFNTEEKECIKRYKTYRDASINESAYGEIGGILRGLVIVPSDLKYQNDIPYAIPGHDIYYIIMHYGKSVSVSVRSPFWGKLNEVMHYAGQHDLVKSAGGHPKASGINFHAVPSNEEIIEFIEWFHDKAEIATDIPF